ncbi:MAG TPA: hypothetical protein VE575_06575 [Acidimicrobiales bacterium]|nr:hypothetical protein [Acidimicrobiales bacterium]
MRDCGPAELAWSRISSTVHWSLAWVPYLLPARVEEKTTRIKRFRDRKGNVFEMRFESVLSPTSHDQRLILYTDTSPDNGK